MISSLSDAAPVIGRERRTLRDSVSMRTQISLSRDAATAHTTRALDLVAGVASIRDDASRTSAPNYLVRTTAPRCRKEHHVL
jgi:hypothetical protein